MNWEREWVVCQHPDHAAKNAKYDHKDGTQDGWTCRNRNCRYHECKYCVSGEPSRCPRCGTA